MRYFSAFFLQSGQAGQQGQDLCHYYDVNSCNHSDESCLSNDLYCKAFLIFNDKDKVNDHLKDHEGDDGDKRQFLPFLNFALWCTLQQLQSQFQVMHHKGHQAKESKGENLLCDLQYDTEPSLPNVVLYVVYEAAVGFASQVSKQGTRDDCQSKHCDVEYPNDDGSCRMVRLATIFKVQVHDQVPHEVVQREGKEQEKAGADQHGQDAHYGSMITGQCRCRWW